MTRKLERGFWLELSDVKDIARIKANLRRISHMPLSDDIGTAIKQIEKLIAIHNMVRLATRTMEVLNYGS